MKSFGLINFLMLASLFFPNWSTQALELDFSPIVSCTFQTANDSAHSRLHWKFHDASFGGSVLEPVQPLSIYIHSTSQNHFQVNATEKSGREFILEAKIWNEDINSAITTLGMIEAGKWIAFDHATEYPTLRTAFYSLQKNEDNNPTHVEAICKSIETQMDSNPNLMSGSTQISKPNSSEISPDKAG